MGGPWEDYAPAPKQPRGIRNNNPGNIEDGDFARSIPGYKGTDGRFAVYDSPEAGNAAHATLLRSYGGRGINTIDGVVQRWAPKTENDTGAYARFVSQKMGVDPRAPLDMNDPKVLSTMAAAMAEHENGQPVTATDAPPWMDYGGKSGPPAASTPAPVATQPAIPQRPPQRTAAAPAMPQRTIDADVGLGALSGAQKGIASGADAVAQAGPLGALTGGLQTAANLASLLQGKSGPGAGKMGARISVNSDAAARNGYKAETGLGRFAEMVGTMLPNAAIPGSAAQRVLNVVAPAGGQFGAEEGAKAAGLDERGQKIAGMVGAGVGGAATGLRLRPSGAKLPTADLAGLKKASDDAWKAVDASGYRFAKRDVRALSADVNKLVQEAGPELYGESAKVARQIASLAQRGELTPAQANRLRSQVGEKLLSPGSTEVSLGTEIKAKLDALIDAGDVPVLKTARDLYTRVKKAEEVSARVHDAELNKNGAGSGGNANAVRQQLKPLVKKKGSQRLTNATPQEIAAIKKVVNGTAGQNALRLLTAFDPTAGKLQALLTGVAGTATLGKTLALAPLGFAAKHGEQKISEANVQKVLDLIAAGGVRPKAIPSRNAAYAGVAGVTAPALIATPAIASPPKRKTRRQR